MVYVALSCTKQKQTNDRLVAFFLLSHTQESLLTPRNKIAHWAIVKMKVGSCYKETNAMTYRLGEEMRVKKGVT